MKKIYIVPQIHIENIMTTSIIATSTMEFGGNANKSTVVDTKSSGNWNLWDDDEE